MQTGSRAGNLFFCAIALSAVLSPLWISAAAAEPPKAAQVRKSFRQAADDSRFLRFINDNDGPRLQTSIVRYQNDAGAIVDLIGAVHIADLGYFEQLNSEFRDYQAVLYELVKPADAGPPGVNANNSTVDSGNPRQSDAAPRGPDAAPREQTERPLKWVGSLQGFMSEQLDLEFQLAGVDYTPANFVHADMDSATFAARQEARGETFLNMLFNALTKEMTNPSAAEDAPTLEEVLSALQAPDRPRQLKLLFAKQFAHMEDSMGLFGGADGSVILDERNAHAMDVLKKELDAGKTKLCIFYGAAHLSGMEKIMTEKMGFKRAGDPRWITAWDLRDSRTIRQAARARAKELADREAKAADAPTTKPGAK